MNLIDQTLLSDIKMISELHLDYEIARIKNESQRKKIYNIEKTLSRVLSLMQHQLPNLFDGNRLEKQTNINVIANLCVRNRYNTDPTFIESLKKIGLSRITIKWFQDIDLIGSNVRQLQFINKYFVPIHLEKIFLTMDNLLKIKIYTAVVNDLGTRYGESTVLINTNEHINSSKDKKQKDAINFTHLYNILSHTDMNFTDKKIKASLVQDKIENLYIPEMFEDFFIELKNITNREKIKTIFQLFLDFSPILKEEILKGNKNKSVKEKLFNQIYNNRRKKKGGKAQLI